MNHPAEYGQGIEKPEAPSVHIREIRGQEHPNPEDLKPRMTRMNTDRGMKSACPDSIRGLVGSVLSFISLLLGAAPSRAAEPVPPNIRLLVSMVEVSHTDLTSLLSNPSASGAEIFTAANALVKSGRAKTVDSAVLTTRNGQATEITTVQEVIYGTEYEPPELAINVPPPVEDIKKLRSLNQAWITLFDCTPSAWDTRNVGLTISAVPELSPDGRSVTLAFIPEWVEYHGDRLIRAVPGPYFNFDIKMPDFRTLRCNTQLTIPTGAFELVSVLTPMNQAPVLAPVSKVLLFVRCEVPGTPAK